MTARHMNIGVIWIGDNKVEKSAIFHLPQMICFLAEKNICCSIGQLEYVQS